MKTRFLAALAVCLLVGTTPAETVSLIAGDPFGDSSFTNGVRWSNSAVPSVGNDYTVALGADALLRAPFATNTNAKSTWEGGPLTLGSDDAAGWLEIPVACKNGSGNVPSQWYDRVEVGDITIRNGGIIFPYDLYSGLLGTSLTVASENEAVVKIGGKWPDGTEGNGVLYFGTALKGDSSQTIRFVKSDTTTKKPYVSLFKDNSGFKGQMIFDGVGLMDALAETMDANRFGGDPGYFRPDALYFPNGFAYELSVREGSRNNNTARTLAPHANRGITFKGGGSIGAYLSNSWTVNVPVVGDTLKVNSGISKFDVNTGGYILFNKQLTVDEVTFYAGNCPRLIFGEDITDESCCLVKLTDRSTVGCRGTCKVRVEATTGCFLDSRANSEATSVGHVIVTPDSVLTNSTVKEVAVLSSGVPAYGYAKVWWPIATLPKTLVEQDKILVRNLQNQEITTYSHEIRDEGDNWVVYIKKFDTDYTYVVPAGTAGNEPEAPYNSWATAANDLPTAIAAATAGASAGARGGTVLVAPGTYDISSPILLEKRIQLRSCDPATGLIDPERTILDGGYPARTNRIMKLNMAQVCGFTFQHGATTATGAYNTYAPGGGAMNIANGTEWRVRNCIFRKNHAIKTYGGAMGCFTSDALDHVFDCLFEENSTLESGSGGAYGVNTTNGDTVGVGFRNCVFRNNVAAGTAGAVYSSNRPSFCTDCTFVDNRAASGNAQVCNLGAGRFIRCVFEQTGADGHLNGSNIAYEGCVFRNIDCPGKMIHLCAGTKSPNIPVQFKDCIVTNCTASCWVCCQNYGGNVPIDNCLVTGNAFGNVIDIHTVGYDFTGCTVANNTLSFTGFYTTSPRDCSIVNSIFWNNVNPKGATYTIERVLNAEAGGKLAVRNSIVMSTEYGKPAKELSNAWVRAPGFVGNGDVHLRPQAFARDKALMLGYCQGDFSVDLDGLPRRVNRRGVAYAADALPDLGCYEAQAPIPATCFIYLK